jgi:hypothetical protein
MEEVRPNDELESLLQQKPEARQFSLAGFRGNR